MSQCEKGVYYWHKETKRTQWHFPEEEAKSQEKPHSYVNIVEQGASMSPQTPQTPATTMDQSQSENTYDEVRTISAAMASTESKGAQNVGSRDKRQPPSTPTRQNPTALSLPEMAPPLPQRRYDDEPEVVEAAPPIPIRRYSPPSLSVPLVQTNSDAAGNRPPREKNPRGEGKSHYATVVVKAPEDDPEAPPLPERTVESEEVLPTGLPEQQVLPDDTIAYAIVCCNGDQAEKPAKKKQLSTEDSAPVAPPPIPSNSPVVDDSTANKKWRTVYEEIDILDTGGGKKATPPTAGAGASPQESGGGGGVSEDGKYMVVDRNKATVLRIVQQPASFPLAAWKPANLPPITSQNHVLPGYLKKGGGPLPSPAGAGVTGKDDHQPPAGGTLAEYDLPFNSRKLLSQPPAASAAGSSLGTGDDPSYSKLLVDKDPMLALRSGVKLRPVSVFGSDMLLTPYPDEGEGAVGGVSNNHSSNEDIIEKCIRALQEDATPTIERATPTSKPSESITSLGYHLQKVPETPPCWMNAQRKPHHYEDVDGDRDEESGDRTSLCTASSRSLPDLDYPELDWDGSDLGALAPTSSSGLVQGTSGSASQPNLLDPKLFAKGTQGGSVSSPGGTGGGGYQQQRRRKNHRYEDIDLDPPGDASDKMGSLKRKVHGSLHVTRSSQPEEKMPRGWQIMTDENGVKYYWHVPSGKTQYEKPTGEQIRRNSTSQLLSDIAAAAASKCQKFTARYINFLLVQESDLVPGECVKVVHACISKLQPSRESSAAVDKGKVVTIQIEDMQMKWISPESTTPLCVQPIGKIRVWGIGLENERDFGYVARDPVSRQHRCHVFRCDNPARTLGQALLQGHQLEKKGGGGGIGESTLSIMTGGSPTREQARLPESREGALSEKARGNNEASSTDVPKPPVVEASEGSLTFACTYMGFCEVTKPSGMDLLNEAVEQLLMNTAHWVNIQLEVTDSCIKIVEGKTKKVLREHRIRFLSFLGIATNSHYCGYIVDLGGKDRGKKFQFHGFKKEPSTDHMCLALHNACQKRYQRVIEASAEVPQLKNLESVKEQDQSENGTKSSIFSRRGSSKKSQKLPEQPEEIKYTFSVYYFGSMVTNKSEGVEAVTEPLQKLHAAKNVQGTPMLISFEISSQGLVLIDPHKRMFSRKTFDVKLITYVARIRNYFAFVVRESGKLYCHVFMEAEMSADSGALVSTIQKVLSKDGSPQKKASAV